MPIGCKVTLRGARAEEFLRDAFWLRNNRLPRYSIDSEGNFSFGIPDHTEFKGMKYDPEIGIFGMDISVCLRRAGARVAYRKRKARPIPKRHRITTGECITYLREKFAVEVIE
jgi:large subunit ribosomal protein L5